MDGHFAVLGIPRGASEADMKKAFKAKALQYHPDRNPKGLEQFKKINTAYEALTTHYKKNGGVDKRGFMEDGGGGGSVPRTNSGRHWGSGGGGSSSYKGPSASTPLFTEEELFGRMPSDNFGIFGGGTGGSSTRQAYTSRANGGGFRQSKQPPPPTSSEMNDAANNAWRTAHGSKVPQSGYNAFKSEAESGAFKSQMKQFEEMERMKRAMGMGGGGAPSSAPQPNRRDSDNSPGGAPKFGRRSPSKFEGSASAMGSSDPSSSRQLPRQGSASSSLFRAKRESAASSQNTSTSETHQQHNSGSAPSYSASQHNIDSQRELEAEWAMERDRQARLKRAQEEMEATERRLRREQREAETREEWERTQNEMDLERTARQVEERTRELHRAEEEGTNVHYVDESIKATARERRREREGALERLLPSRPLLDKMTIQELYMLRELTNEFQSKLFSMTESRINSQTMCLICHASKKDPRTTEKFRCGHCCICYSCCLTCALCPICGKERTDM